MGTLDCIIYSGIILSVLHTNDMEGFLIQQIFQLSYDVLS